MGLSKILDSFKIIKDKTTEILIHSENKLGENKFRKVLFLLFCVFLFFVSYYISKDMLSGKIYLKIAAIIALLVALYLIKRLETFFYLLIFSLPFINFPLVAKFDALNFANGLYAFFLFIYLFRGVINNKILIPRTYLDWPIGLTIFVFFISIIQTRYITHVVYVIKKSFINAPYFRSIFQLGLFIFIMSSFYVTVSFLKDKEKIKTTIRIWICSSIVVALLGLYGYFFASYGMPFASKFLVAHTTRICSVFKEPIFYGLYFASVIPLLYSLILNKSYILPKKYMYIAFVLNMVAMFLSLSRSSWMATIVTIIIISSMNMKFKSLRAKIAAVIIIIILVLSIVAGVFFVSQFVSQANVEKSVLNIFTGKDFSALARVDAMATAWAIFKSHPIFGAGLGNYYFHYLDMSPFYDIIYTWFKESTPSINPDANNMYLTVMSETGILGFMCVLSIFLSIFFNIIKTLKKPGNEYWKPFLKGYLGSIVFLLIIYLFTSTLVYVFIWVMFGIIVAIQRQAKTSDQS